MTKVKRVDKKQRKRNERQKIKEWYDNCFSDTSPSSNSDVSENSENSDNRSTSEMEWASNKNESCPIFNETNNFFEEYAAKFESVESENPRPIYTGASIRVIQFVFAYCLLVQKLHISREGAELLLKFITSILPDASCLPKTYEECLKKFGHSKIKTRKVCVVCYLTLPLKETCNNAYCIRQKITRPYVNAIDPCLFIFDYVTRLKELIAHYWEKIIAYKNELANCSNTDVCNSGYLKTNASNALFRNSIFLIFFFDGTSFTKSSLSGKIWACLAIISNLPPKIRNEFSNILKILFINGNTFSFNVKYLENIWITSNFLPFTHQQWSFQILKSNKSELK